MKNGMKLDETGLKNRGKCELCKKTRVRPARKKVGEKGQNERGRRKRTNGRDRLFPPIDFLYIKRYNKTLTEQTALVENLQKGRR